MKRSARHAMIIEAVADKARISTHSLSVLTGASTVTIRRDLAELDERGLIRRVHGGAAPPIPLDAGAAFNTRVGALRDEKGAIARLISAYLLEAHGESDGQLRQSISFDASTTTLAVARALAGQPIEALAISIPTAAALVSQEITTVTMPGGRVDFDTQMLTGTEVGQTIANFSANTTIISAAGISDNGIFAATTDAADIKRTLIKNSQLRIVACPVVSSQGHTHRISTFEPIDVLALPSRPPAWLLQAAKRAGCQVIWPNQN